MNADGHHLTNLFPPFRHQAVCLPGIDGGFPALSVGAAAGGVRALKIGQQEDPRVPRSEETDEPVPAEQHVR